MTAVVGIDPGAKGSLCFLDLTTKEIRFHPVPGGKYTCAHVFYWLKALQSDFSIAVAGVEEVHAIFGTSANSNFTFGFNVGLIRGLVEATEIGLDLVKPKVWQKAIGIPESKLNKKGIALKKLIEAAALRLYPHARLHGPKGGLLDGRADALMIAHYLALKYQGGA